MFLLIFTFQHKKDVFENELFTFMSHNSMLLLGNRQDFICIFVLSRNMQYHCSFSQKKIRKKNDIDYVVVRQKICYHIFLYFTLFHYIIIIIIFVRCNFSCSGLWFYLPSEIHVRVLLFVCWDG